MTREEAIKEIENIKKFNYTLAPLEVFDMAIKALEQEPCDNAVSRQAVFDLMRSLPKWYVRSKDGKYNNVGLLYDDVMFGIDNLPTVNPQPKTGEWIKSKDGYMRCDRCGSRGSAIKARFCHHCGARMIEPQESEEE